MNNSPTSVKVLDTIYKIRRFSDTEATGDFGTLDPRKCTISVNVTIPQTLAGRTLWHEIKHVDQVNKQEDMDEDEAVAFAELVSGVLMNNPELVEFYYNLVCGPQRIPEAETAELKIDAAHEFSNVLNDGDWYSHHYEGLGCGKPHGEL